MYASFLKNELQKDINMKIKKYVLVIMFLMSLLFLSQDPVMAIPSFARQTNLSCSSCHTMFPELNSFGRMFKLNGYTLIGMETVQSTDKDDNVTLRLLKIPEVSSMLQASYTYTSKKQPDTQNNNISFPQQLSLFLAGEITPSVGGFIQVTYDDQSGSIGLDNSDIRYANQTELASKDLIYGVTLNNNPSMQDIWNSTPAWSFPYASSAVAPSPSAATLIEGGLAQSAAGLGAYGLWNNLVYGEVSVYRSAQQGAPNPPDNTSSGIIKSLAPYWRFALQHQFGTNYLELGTYGLSADLYPSGITGLTDKYTDIGVDLNYEKNLGSDMITTHTTWVHESQNIDASLAPETGSVPANSLNSFKLVGNYYIHNEYGFSLGYFSINGDAVPALYTDSSLNGKPNSDGLIAQFNYAPWLNTKFSLQYVAYNKFDGASSNYDGSGRNASDNNTVYVDSWIAF
jgi:hypothetical protein